MSWLDTFNCGTRFLLLFFGRYYTVQHSFLHIGECGIVYNAVKEAYEISLHRVSFLALYPLKHQPKKISPRTAHRPKDTLINTSTSFMLVPFCPPD